MSKIKYRKLYFLFMILEILLLIMISGWYYFAERKMGMIRHILFRNVYKFPKYFTDINIKVIIACFIVILVIQLVLFLRARRFLFSFILNIVFIIFEDEAYAICLPVEWAKKLIFQCSLITIKPFIIESL